MGSQWINAVCKTGVFIICAQVLVHFRPNSSYEKYMKMLVSAMILLQLFLPVSSLFTEAGERSLASRVSWFQSQLEESMERAASDYEEMERRLEQTAADGLAEQVIPQAAELFEGDAGTPDRLDPVGKIRVEPMGKIQIKSFVETEKEDVYGVDDSVGNDSET